jgi:ATP-dependent RNA helicase DDX46/PRP5
VAPGRTPAPGERKIYLYIEGPDRSSVIQAKAEIKRMINEAAASAHPDREQYGKYTI